MQLMPRDADALLLTADVLASDNSNGEVRCKLGEATTGQGKSADVPMYCSHGFVGVPEAPDEDGSACQAFYAQDGDEQKIVGTRDNRLAGKLGEMKDGDRAIVNLGEARFDIKRDKDAVSTSTKNKKTGKPMRSLLDGDAGEIHVDNGDASAVIKPDEIVLAVAGGASIRVGKDGTVKIVGTVIQAIAPVVQLGDQGGGQPPPPSPAGAVAIGPQPGAVSTKVFASA